MLYIKTLSSNKIDLFLERFDTLETLEFRRRDIQGRVNLFIAIFNILYRNKEEVIFVSEERVEFRLLSRIFATVEFRVIHLGLLFIRKPELSQIFYKALYPSILSVFFRGINGLNSFSKHYVFYEENISVLETNNPKCSAELVPLEIVGGVYESLDSNCILLIPSAWGHHGHRFEEIEQWENFRILSDFFSLRGYKIFIKPHPRGDMDLLYKLGKLLSCELNIIETLEDYPGSIVIGNVSTLLVDMQMEGYDVYKSLTNSMYKFNNHAIDKLRNIDLLIKK